METVAQKEPLIPSVELIEDASLPVDDDHLAKAGIPSSMINILNTILGSGMLAMPSAISSVGIILGVICIGFSGLLSAFGLFLLVKCAEYVGRTSSFNSISRITFPVAAPFFDMAIAIKCFGVSVSYLVIIGDLMPDVIDNLFNVGPDHILRVRQFWITSFMIVIIPFSFLRRLNSLKYTSFVALVAVMYLFVLTIYFYSDPARVPPPADEIHLWNPQLLFFKNIPLFVFAFTCHQNIFAVYNELKRNTPTRTNAIIGNSIFISTTTYLVVGVLGYLMYGDKVASNVLNNFDDSLLVTVGRIAITILNAFSFPLQCHPARASFDKVLDKFINRNSILTNDNLGGYYTLGNEDSILDAEGGVPVDSVLQEDNIQLPTAVPKEMSQFRFVTITCGIIIFSYLIAFFVSDLKVVLGLVGATGSTTICYILPGLFYFTLKNGEPGYFFTRWLAFGLMILGFAIMFTSIGFILFSP